MPALIITLSLIALVVICGLFVFWPAIFTKAIGLFSRKKKKSSKGNNKDESGFHTYYDELYPRENQLLDAHMYAQKTTFLRNYKPDDVNYNLGIIKRRADILAGILSAKERAAHECPGCGNSFQIKDDYEFVRGTVQKSFYTNCRCESVDAESFQKVAKEIATKMDIPLY